MLTPIDIREKEFEKGRNYTREVREFLIKVASEYEVIYSKNVELSDKIEQMESLLSNYKNIEETMKNALVLAQKTADSTIEAANKEAENILINAKMQADKLHVESLDKNNRIKLANKTLFDRFETYKKMCSDVLNQHLEMINLIEVKFNDDDINVAIDDIDYDNEIIETEDISSTDNTNVDNYDEYLDEDFDEEFDDLTDEDYDAIYDELDELNDFDEYDDYIDENFDSEYEDDNK